MPAPIHASDAGAHAPCAARRALLAGAGAAGVALLAGCGDDGDRAAAPGPAGSAAAASGTPPVATTPADPFPTGDGGFPPLGALTATSEVPVGGGVVIRDSVLVVQPKKGTFKAFNASCPHQGVLVDAPVPGDTQIDCPGHNSKFDLASGAKKSGPAPRGLSAIAIKVDGGYIVQV